MRFLRALPKFLLAGLLASALSGSAQNAQARIRTVINENSRTTLTGNVPPAIRFASDQGEVAASTTMSHMRLVLSRSSERQAALTQYMDELQDSASANYHKWLTPQQFGSLYGATDSDIQTLVQWLQGHGFTVEPLAEGRTSISFSGTAAQVTAAFHTPIHSFARNGEIFVSNTAEPQIPTALAEVVRGVAQLNTLRPHRHSHAAEPGFLNPSSMRKLPLSAESSDAHALLTGGSGTSSSPYTLYITPGDAATIYDTPNSTLNANYTSSNTTYNGSGVKIGVGGDALILASTFTNFRSSFIGDSATPTIVNVDGIAYATNSGDRGEAYIDTELAGGLAPGASIYFYVSTDLTSGMQKAIDDNTVDIFSLSFGDCEADLGTSNNAWLNALWEQAAAQGIAVTVSTGDSGSAGCDYTSDSNGNTVTAATGGLAVNGFASTPYNVAVGGTDLVGLTSSYSQYASTSQGSSSTYYRTAKSYIPESTWNDSTVTDTTIAKDEDWISYGDSSYASIAAGSGGASSCATETSSSVCSAGYAKPSWQTGSGVPSDGVRDIPDVSLMAGAGGDDAAWLVCDDSTAQTSSGTTVSLNCGAQSNGSSYFNAYGGTSTAAPAFAGILALVQQKQGSRLGQAAKTLYTLYNGSHGSSVFHDTTVGNNAVPCSSGSTNCTRNTGGYYFLTGYNTTTGYDLATGLGSVDAALLVNYWSASVGSTASTVTATNTATAATTVNNAITISGTVASGSTGTTTTPTGQVSIFQSGGGYSTSATLTSGAYQVVIPANTFPSGSITMEVAYEGDTTFATASNSTTFTVNAMAPTVTVTAPSSANTANTVSVGVTVTGPSGSTETPSGTVTVSGGGYSSSAQSLSTSGSYTFTIPANSLSGGADTLTVSYSGDSYYTLGSGQASINIVTTALVTPTVTVTPASTTIDSGQSLKVTVGVTGSSATPTGSITLKSGSTSLGTGTLDTTGSTSITVAANTLSVGNDTLTATYSGDANYATYTGSATVTVTASSYTLAATNPASISAGGTATSTITATSSTNYTGTVKLTCAVTTALTSYSYLPTCSVSPSTIVLSNGTAAATSTISVYTTAATSAAFWPDFGRGRKVLGGSGAGAMLALLLLGVRSSWRRKWLSVLMLVFSLSAVGALVGCGGSSGSSSTGSAGTTSGTYTITVSGAGSDIASSAASTTFTVTVN